MTCFWAGFIEDPNTFRRLYQSGGFSNFHELPTYEVILNISALVPGPGFFSNMTFDEVQFNGTKTSSPVETSMSSDSLHRRRDTQPKTQNHKAD